MFQGAVTASSPQSSCRDTRTERNARTHRLSKIAARDAFVMSQKIAILRTDKSSGALLTALSRAGYEVRSRLEHIRAWARPLQRLGPNTGHEMTGRIGIRPIIFSVNCYIAAILALFVSFSLDLKTPVWAMLTVYLTSQPLSGALRGQ